MQQEQTTLVVPAHRSRSFLNASRYGFRFTTSRKCYTERCQKKEDIIADIGERPKPFTTVISFLCIGVALVFALIEAYNVQATIIGATGIGETTAILVGFGFATAGLIAGEMLTASWKYDAFTGKKKPTPKFYIAIAFALVYLIGQYWLASRAGIGADADMQDTVETMQWFVLGIALAEILFGMAFLATAIKVVTLLVADFRIKRAISSMNRNSRQCEEHWQRYAYECNGQNMQVETEAITDARRYYSTGTLDTPTGNQKAPHYLLTTNTMQS